MKCDGALLTHGGGGRWRRRVTSAAVLWENLEGFLRAVVPVAGAAAAAGWMRLCAAVSRRGAEKAGVTLAIHPDDPPLPVLRGKPQILYNVTELLKVV